MWGCGRRSMYTFDVLYYYIIIHDTIFPHTNIYSSPILYVYKCITVNHPGLHSTDKYCDMITAPIRIRAKTDKNRHIILHPTWCSKKREYLLYDEAVIQYRNAFNKPQSMFVKIMMDGKDVSKRRFVIKQEDKDDIVIRSDIGNNDDRFTIIADDLSANDDDDGDSISSKPMKSYITDFSCHHPHKTKRSHILATTLNLEKLLAVNTEFNVEIVDQKGFKMHLLNLPPGKFVGAEDNTKPEIHPTTTQIILVQTGKALVRLYAKNSETGVLEQEEVVFISSKKEDTIIIPHDTYHLIENVDTVPFTAVSIYSPIG